MCIVQVYQGYVKIDTRGRGDMSQCAYLEKSVPRPALCIFSTHSETESQPQNLEHALLDTDGSVVAVKMRTLTQDRFGESPHQFLCDAS